MVKRNKQEIYGALGEYIFNNKEDLLNEEQLKIAKQHEGHLRKLLKKSQRERKRHKIYKFIFKIPTYILEGIRFILDDIISNSFFYLADKVDDLRVAYENKFQSRIRYSKSRRKVNDYAFNKVLPLLVEKEKDDGMYQKQRDYTEKLRKELDEERKLKR